MIICKICGKEYKSIQPLSKHISSKHSIEKQQYYDLYLKDLNEGICIICGKSTNFYGMDRGYNTYCSRSCQVKAQNNFNSVNYKNQWQSKNKFIQEYEKLHNCTHIKHISKYKLHSIHLQHIPIIRLSKMYQFAKNEDLATIEDPMFFASNYEQHIFTSLINENVLCHTKKYIYPYELDFYLPDKRLAIEFNGTYYHSTKRKSEDYHLMKSLMCRDKNIRLIHIYEFEDFNKQLFLLSELIKGNDLYPKNDFNKNNLIDEVPTPEIIFQSDRLTVYGAGPLIKENNYV